MNNIIDQLYDAFPFQQHNIIEKLLGKVKIESNLFIASDDVYTLSSGIINIPYRIYINESVLESNTLADEEKRILMCYFTRHHNGYIRQKCLEELMNKNQLREYEVPYIIMLTGEYVIEIVEIAFNLLKRDSNKGYLMQIITNNQSQIKYQHSRMVSYWNEYYRKKYFKSFDQIILSNWEYYIGSKIIKLYKELNYQ